MSKKENYLKAAVTGTVHGQATAVPQSAPVSENQVKNNAGGYGFAVDNFTRLNRFLMLGSQDGSYYQGERDLTRENIDNIVAVIKSDGMRVAQRVHEVSTRGLALKQDPTLFTWALLMKYGDDPTRSWVYAHTSEVARTGTHIMRLVDYMTTVGGWSRGKRTAVANWFLGKNSTQLAYQLAKYRARYGWTNKDLLRVAHPAVSADSDVSQVMAFVAGKIDAEALGAAIGNNAITASDAAFRAAEAGDIAMVCAIAAESNLSWEMLPTEVLKVPEIWDVLVQNSGYQALLRNLNRLTINGWLTPGSPNRTWLINKLTDDEFITRSKIHPFSIYLAAKTYATGRGQKGSQTWAPVTGITAALDKAFTKAFVNVEPTNLSYLLALDVSGSMESASPMTGVTCMEASAALATIMLRTEPNVQIVAFSNASGTRATWATLHAAKGDKSDFDGLVPVNLDASSTITSVKAAMDSLSMYMTGTDCSLPMRWATDKGYKFDAFMLFTDSETWAGPIHPHVALSQYRGSVNHNARSMVVGMTAGNFTIADPADSGMMDVAGLSSDLPELARQFFLGEI